MTLVEPVLDKVAAGDRDAVAACLDRYSNLVWSLARRFTNSQADAEDAVQEVFIDLWSNAARFDPGKASETTFVAMIARRRLIDRFRKRTREPGTEELDAVSEVGTAHPELEAEQRDEAARASKLIQSLKPDQQRIIRLAVYEGRTHQSIADELGVPLGTVKTQLRRGLLRIREAMRPGASAFGRGLEMNTRDQLLDLLVARATEGLPEEGFRELQRLLRGQQELRGDEVDLAAAAADLALSGHPAEIGAVEPMPAHLRESILTRAESYFREHLEAGVDETATVIPIESGRAARRGPLSPSWYGWYAAAAALLLAIWSPWNVAPVPSPNEPTPIVAPTMADQRQTLIDSAPDLVQVAWNRPEIAGYAEVTGDVVWSDERQEGFMRLRGLPANDATVEQYQLWIVDPSRDKNPIDGGVFDITAGAGELIVPIDAKLTVNSPAAFAITLEQPGGVVVSAGPLLVVAPVQT